MSPTIRAALIVLSLTGSARAQDAASPADAAEISRVITAQIEAFRRNDAAAAFAFATPGIQEKFGDSTHFVEAVKQAYPQVYRPRSFKFTGMGSEDGLVTQRVEIVGPDGRLVTAIYDMAHEQDGSWRIAGCRLLESDQQET